MAGERGAKPNTRPSWRSRVPHLFYRPLLRPVLLLAVVVTALVLGYLGLRQDLATPSLGKLYGRSWSDILYYDIQLPFLNAEPAGGPGPFPVDLGIARLLAPVGTVLAAVFAAALLLGEQWRRLRIALSFRKVIVTGDGPLALALARNLGAEKKRKVVLVSSDDATLSEARRSDLLTFQAELADPGWLRDIRAGGASELFACTDRGADNLDITVLARNHVRRARKWPLKAYARLRDEELELFTPLRAAGIGGHSDERLRMDFFAVEDIAARRLLDSHPLPAGSDCPEQVIISGFGHLGHAVLREIARRRQTLPDSPLVNVVIRHATRPEVAMVEAAFPAITRTCLITCDPAAGPPAGGKYLAYVCLDGDDTVLSEGLALAHSLAAWDGDLVFCLRETGPLGRVIAAKSGLADVRGTLSAFGIFEEVCVPDNIRDDFTEQIARSIHAKYVANERAKGYTEDENPSTVPWERLPADLRHANMDQAADIDAKMAAINAVVAPRTAGAPEFAFTEPEEVDWLAEREHERWMRERRAQGWTYGAVRDNARKLHPAMVPWDDLDEEDKDKDRNAIRATPAILRDAGFQILRLPKAKPDV
jgi:hypothetical protein